MVREAGGRGQGSVNGDCLKSVIPLLSLFAYNNELEMGRNTKRQIIYAGLNHLK